MLLSIFRCIDHFYYFEFTDPEGLYYGVARVHFQTISNRRARPDKKYAGDFEKRMALNMSRFAHSPEQRRADSVVVKSRVFNHISKLILADKLYMWNDYC